MTNLLFASPVMDISPSLAQLRARRVSLENFQVRLRHIAKIAKLVNFRAVSVKVSAMNVKVEHFNPKMEAPRVLRVRMTSLCSKREDYILKIVGCVSTNPAQMHLKCRAAILRKCRV
jgi:hypothetical protein